MTDHYPPASGAQQQPQSPAAYAYPAAPQAPGYPAPPGYAAYQIRNAISVPAIHEAGPRLAADRPGHLGSRRHRTGPDDDPCCGGSSYGPVDLPLLVGLGHPIHLLASLGHLHQLLRPRRHNLLLLDRPPAAPARQSAAMANRSGQRRSLAVGQPESIISGWLQGSRSALRSGRGVTRIRVGRFARAERRPYDAGS